MRIISRKALREFWKIHPVAESPLVAWFRIVKLGKFADFNAIKRTFGAADYVAPFTIFDIGGNKFRVITAIHYNRQRLYIRHVLRIRNTMSGRTRSESGNVNTRRELSHDERSYSRH